MTPHTFHYLLNSDLDTDPDAAFQVNPDPDQIWIQGFDDQNFEELNRAKFFNISFFDKKNCNLPYP
jgi:hypothetical protein